MNVTKEVKELALKVASCYFTMSRLEEGKRTEKDSHKISLINRALEAQENHLENLDAEAEDKGIAIEVNDKAQEFLKLY